MKRLAYLVLGSAAVLALVAAGCRPGSTRGYGSYRSPPPYFAAAPAPPLDVSVEVIYTDLAAYGTWTEHPAYGHVWRPRGVPADWRPYTLGHWVDTDEYGWAWVSDWPWGFIPFHYGRWVWDGPYGWVWVPGTEWGPAWVAWRRGGGYIGWAPLPPRVHWSVGVGFRIGPDDLDAIEAAAWCFVPERYFLEPPHGHAMAPSTNVTVIRVTKNVTNIVNVGGRPVNRSIPRADVERIVGRPVPRTRVYEVRTPQEFRQTPRRPDAIPVFRPRTDPAKQRPATPWADGPRTAPGRVADPAPQPPNPPRVEADQRRQAEYQRRQQESRRKAEAERRQAEGKQKAEAQRRAEGKRRQAEGKRQAEAQRQQQQSQRKAEDQRQAETRRRAEDERRQAEARRQADAQRQQQEDQRKAEDQRRQAEGKQKAEAQRRAEGERRQAETQRQAEAQRQQQQSQRKAEDQRQAETQRQAEAQRRAEGERRQAEGKRQAEAQRQQADREKMPENGKQNRAHAP